MEGRFGLAEAIPGKGKNYRAMFLPAGGSYESDLGFYARSILVTNPTGQWLFLPNTWKFVPPQTFGMVIPVPSPSQKAHVVWAAPPGVGQPVAVSTQFALIEFLEFDLPPASGNTLQQQGSISIGTVNQGGPNAGGPSAWPVTISGTANVTGSVTISNVPHVVVDSGTITIANFPAVQTVSSVDGGLTTIGSTTDAASANTLVGLSKRLLSILPASLGQKAMAGSLAVTLASDQTPISVQGLPTFRDTGNEQSGLLGNGGVFTGAWREIDEYQSLVLSWYSFQQPASYQVQFSADGVNVDNGVTQSVPPFLLTSAGIWTVFASFNPGGNKYYRIVVTNGTTPQTFVQATNLVSIAPYTGQYQQLAQQPSTASPALLVRAVLAAQRTDSGAFENIAANPNGQLEINQAGAYNQSLGQEEIALPYISQDKAQFNAPFANNNVATVATGGATTVQSAAAGAVLTSANAAGASKSQIQGQKKIRFSPGRQAVEEVSAAFPAAGLANSDVLIGLTDVVAAPIGGAANSILVGFNGTAFVGLLVSGGVITTQFTLTLDGSGNVTGGTNNGDPLTGLAFSSFTSLGVPVVLNITQMRKWRIRYVWGVGPVVWEVKNLDGDWVTVHTAQFTGSTPYIQNPDLFMIWDVTKLAAAGAGTLILKSLSASAGTVEPEIDFEVHEIHGHKQVDVAMSGVAILNTGNSTLYTVSPGRQLLVKTISIGMNNTGTGQRLEIRDGGAAGALRYAVQGSSQANGAVGISPSFPIPLIFLTDVTIVGVGTGTLTISGGIIGYEKEV